MRDPIEESEESGALLSKLHDELVADGLLEKLVLGGIDERVWSDCDLASIAEGRLGEHGDPRTLSDATRDAWSSSALDEPLWPLTRRARYDTCFWIMDGAVRVGTIALAASVFRSRATRLSSLYVFAEHRGRGHARTIMREIVRRFGDHGLGVSLNAFWTWQRAVQLYVDLGFWLRHWKDDLLFEWLCDAPSPHIVIGDDEATLSIIEDGAQTVLVRATRDGDRLTLVREPVSERHGLVGLHAPTTLALAIALRGWPLLRGGTESWASASDAVNPEGLATRIEIWEAWAHKRRWLVGTPRIPGLAYPTWDELEARWSAFRAAMENDVRNSDAGDS